MSDRTPQDNQIIIEHYERTIAQLEQQLAESERQRQKLQEALESSLDSQQGDEQMIAEMRARLAQISRSVPIILHKGRGEALDEWYCPVCSVSLPVKFPPKPPPHPFPHAESCALAQTSAFLAAHPAPEEGGLEADDDE